MPGHRHRYENRTINDWKKDQKEIFERTTFLDSEYTFEDRFHILRLNLLKSLPICKMCGKGAHFFQSDKFFTFCSRPCASKWNNNTDEQKAKTAQSWKKKYGVDHPFQSKDIREKSKQTCLERYGVEHPLQSKDIREKVERTCLERYGVRQSLQSPTIREKSERTCLERYGVTNARQSDTVKEKSKQTCLERYGVEHPFQNLEVLKQISFKSCSLSKEDHDTLFDRFHCQDWWNRQTSFVDVKNTLKDVLTVPRIYLYAHRFRPDWDFKSSVSSPHRRVIELLEEHEIEHQFNTRQVIPPLELDIYIPSKSLAIEVNGVYWHSESVRGKDKDYHLNKTLECEKKNITLLQFWDIEVESQWDIVSSMILSKIGVYKNKIGARKCQVQPVAFFEEKDFLEKNHLQGYVPSSICYGLYHEGELASLMSFGKSRFTGKNVWELLRFCNRINTRVIGGASKLFKMKPEGSIVSYSDRRYSRGNIYKNLGFTLKHDNAPSYRYTHNYRSLESRIKYQKHKLSRLLESFDPSLTEWENMKMNGYDRVWDCGTRTFTNEV